MKKFLFFNDANNDAALYPIDNLLSISHEANDTVMMRFASSKPLSERVVATPAMTAITLVDEGNDDIQGKAAQTAAITAGAIAYDEVILTVTAGTLAKDAVGAICRGINEAPHSTGFITICDDINSVFIHSSIASCAITYALA